MTFLHVVDFQLCRMYCPAVMLAVVLYRSFAGIPLPLICWCISTAHLLVSLYRSFAGLHLSLIRWSCSIAHLLVFLYRSFACIPLSIMDLLALSLYTSRAMCAVKDHSGLQITLQHLLNFRTSCDHNGP